MSIALLHLIYTDDNPDDSYIVGKCLQKASLLTQFNWLNNGKELLSYLQKHPPYQDRKNIKAQHFILLDINMPGLDGFEVLSHIKLISNEEVLKVPIFMFSSSDREEDREKSLKLGADGYLVKPAHYQDLYSILNNLLMIWNDPHKTPITNI